MAPETPADNAKPTAQLPFEYRKGVLLEAKRLIARKATSLCTDGETVIIDGGIVYPDSQLVFDPFQEERLRNYSATKVFMGVYGIDDL
jgi:DeoR/GlpR family transcriptional regulator of sugar metabolism